MPDDIAYLANSPPLSVFIHARNVEDTPVPSGKLLSCNEDGALLVSSSGTQEVTPAPASATGTGTEVELTSGTSTEILPSNTARVGATIYNPNTSSVFVDFGGGTATNRHYELGAKEGVSLGAIVNAITALSPSDTVDITVWEFE